MKSVDANMLLDIDFLWNNYRHATLIVITHETNGYVHSLGY